MTVDLHLHTTASDGSFAPAKLVKKAVKLNLKTIAITDHDTIDGIEEAKMAAMDKKLEVIPGIELNTEIEGEEVHILGYYINYNDLDFIAELDKLWESRYNRIKKMIKKLQRFGLEVSFKRVCQIAGGGTLGRVHLAKAMIEAGYVSEISRAFDEYIGKNCPAYVERSKLDPFSAVELIKSAGGIPVLAHPDLLGNDYLIPELIKAGLAGLEVYHSEHEKFAVKYYSNLADRHGLIKTGGSDCHGDKDTILMGTVNVSQVVVDNLKDRTVALV